MFNDDEYYLDDEELAADTQLSIIDNHKIKILDTLIESAMKMKETIRFNETSDTVTLVEILSNYMTQLIRLEEVSQDLDISAEEVQELLLEIERSTTEITYNNIDRLIEDKNVVDEITEEDDDTDSSLDF